MVLLNLTVHGFHTKISGNTFLGHRILAKPWTFFPHWADNFTTEILYSSINLQSINPELKMQILI